MGVRTDGDILNDYFKYITLADLSMRLDLSSAITVKCESRDDVIKPKLKNMPPFIAILLFYFTKSRFPRLKSIASI